MVGRRQELARALVVDLDGTLIRENSFRLYVKAGLRSRHAPALLAATLLRRLGAYSHNAYRERCMRIIGFGADVLERMTSEAHRSEAVDRYINARRAEGYRIILATAALQGYVEAFGFSDYVATRHDSGRILLDCRGEAKLQAVRSLLGGRLPEYFLSDSPADAPLMRAVAEAGGRAVLVNPSPESLEHYRAIIPGVEILRD